MFQFTHPCGCDLGLIAALAEATGFNSRTRVGATCIEMGLPRYDEVSIHAPVWVRPPIYFSYPQDMMFQFTHPCGCDLYHLPHAETSGRFNSRTRVGATFDIDITGRKRDVSIHAPVWVRQRKR